jgi:hypothetical protein
MAEAKKATKKSPAKGRRAGAKTKKAKSDGERGREEGKAATLTLPGLGEAVTWIGDPVDDSGGNSVGRVSGIHADADSDEPKWLIVRLGTFAGDAAVPFEHTAEGAGRVWLAYRREEVRGSPKLSAGQALTAKQELQLCEHYGIPASAGRAAELGDRDGEQVSAVPAAG